MSKQTCDVVALRERVSAIISEFDVPLPEGDAGIFEAARRLSEIQVRFEVLSQDFGDFTCEIEAVEIIPHRERLEKTLFDHLEKHAEPRTLAAAAVMLRHALEGGVAIEPDDGMIANLLALIEREGNIEPIATLEQTAAIEFEPFSEEDGAAVIDYFSGKSWAKECRNDGIALRVSTRMVRLTKQMLVKSMPEFLADDGAALKETVEMLHRTKEQYERFAEILQAAEVRLLIAASAFALQPRESAAGAA